jgi:hypothetical protein
MVPTNTSIITKAKNVLQTHTGKHYANSLGMVLMNLLQKEDEKEEEKEEEEEQKEQEDEDDKYKPTTAGNAPT